MREGKPGVKRKLDFSIKTPQAAFLGWCPFAFCLGAVSKMGTSE